MSLISFRFNILDLKNFFDGQNILPHRKLQYIMKDQIMSNFIILQKNLI